MSDLATWKLHGPVATLRTETATWDSDQQKWQAARYFTITSFHPDGKTGASDTHNPEGSIVYTQYVYDDAGRLTERHSWMNDEPILRTMYSYDEAGRHIRTANQNHDGTQTDLEICTYDADGKGTKTRILHGYPGREERAGLGAVSLGYSIEDTDMFLGAPGATVMTTTYVGARRPAKVILEDADHNSVIEVLFERDASGRLLNVETRLSSDSLFQDMAERVPPESREQAVAAFKKIFGDGFSRTSYVHDLQGRLVERTNSMGTLKEDRTTYRYDDLHDQPVEETTEYRSRQADLDDDGNVQYEPDTVNVQHNRFEYRYDTHGNWTERIVSFQPEGSPDFQRSNIERRTITYHAG